jgi:hypothetical protein
VYGAIRSRAFASTRRKFDAWRYIEQFGAPADRDRYRALTAARPLRR